MTRMIAMMTVALFALGARADDAPGLKVGDKAPEFSLVDQNGKKRTLKNLSNGKKVALVFHRSARW